MKTTTKLSLGLAGAALFCVAASRHNNDDDGPGRHDGAWQTIVFDVACDGRTYAPNGLDPTKHTEIRGTTFIVDGKIYPGGTIARGDGFDLDATPGIGGKWVCRGTYNVRLEEFLAGVAPSVSTTWHLLFDARNALMTEGQEGGTVRRVVLGGTGRYRAFVGEVNEEVLGFNSTGFENFRFTFKVRKAD
jgi:hypothetical protein